MWAPTLPIASSGPESLFFSSIHLYVIILTFLTLTVIIFVLPYLTLMVIILQIFTSFLFFKKQSFLFDILIPIPTPFLPPAHPTFSPTQPPFTPQRG